MPTLFQALERQGVPLTRADRIMAAYKPDELEAGVREHFKDLRNGTMKCRLCGSSVKHPRAAQAHMADMHKKELDAMRAKGIQARDFSDKQRDKLSDKGKAMPHGGFPIVTRNDLENAVRAIGRAKDRGATIRFILKRAKALGAMDAIPDKWKRGQEDSSVDSAVTGVHPVGMQPMRGPRMSEGGSRSIQPPPRIVSQPNPVRSIRY